MSVVGHLKQTAPDTLAEILAGTCDVGTYLFPEQEAEDTRSLYLDKAWHAVHYLLNGKAWEGIEPLVHVVLGGTPLGQDYGHGPVRYLTAEEVSTIAEELAHLHGKKLTDRYRPADMKKQEIYPEIEWEEAETRQYVFDHYGQVVDYYRDAAAKGNGMLLYLTS